MTRYLALAALLLVWSSPGKALSEKGCQTGGKMVQSFASLRLQGKPLQDVYDFIDHKLQPAPDAQQRAFYEHLAEVTYRMDFKTSEEARDGFLDYCRAEIDKGH